MDTRACRTTEPRFFPGQRWVHIGLRALHLIGIAGIGVGFLFSGVPGEAWHPYLLVTLASGVAMVLLDLWSDPGWLDQIAGQAVLLKLCLVALIPIYPGAGATLFISVILLSAVVSHAPGRVRHYSIRHRRVVGGPRKR